MIRPSQIPTLKACEKALDDALKTLRALQPGSNTMAQVSLEYRIGALRRRRTSLMEQA
jgi:hypothetical protein